MRLITEKIEEITPKGIRTADGTEHELDTIIFATGFDLIKSGNYAKVTGAGGTDFAKCIGDTPAAMNGVVIVSKDKLISLSSPELFSDLELRSMICVSNFSQNSPMPSFSWGPTLVSATTL